MKTPSTSPLRQSLGARRWSLSTGQLVGLLAGTVLLSAGCATLAQREAALILRNAEIAALFKGGGVMQCTGFTGPESRCIGRVGVNTLKAQVSGERSADNTFYLCRPTEQLQFNEATQSMECVPLKFAESGSKQ